MQITTELFIAEKKIMGCAVLCTPHSVFSVQIISELPVEFILFSVFGNIDRIISSDQAKSKIGATFECASTMYGTERRFKLYYSSISRMWVVEKIGR